MNPLLSRLVRRRRTVAVAVTAALVGAFAVVPAASAAVPTSVSPVLDRPSGGVTADGLPTVQIDGVVWSQAIIGNTVYAGGSFANARPAGAAPGTNLTPRANLLAYNLTTGALITSFNPSLNAQVKVVAASPDGSKIYVGGSFTTADGQPRYRLAAYDTATGTLDPNFHPTLDAAVNALAVTNTTVYAGGVFSNANGVARSRLAAFSASTGATLGWAPTADNVVDAMVLTPDGGHVIVGGAFANINGSQALGLASVDANTGAMVPFAVNQTVQDYGSAAAILSLTTDGTSIFGSGYVFGSPGNLEGVFSADPTTGAINWIEDCHGDTYDTYPSASEVYVVSHEHYCSTIGGFPDSNPRNIWYRTTAFSKNATGTVQTNTESGYANWAGQPSPSLLAWYPTLAAGTYTGQDQAAWTVTGNSQYVVEGGEFPSVNGIAQQGLVRFAVHSIAPDKIGPQDTSSATTPTVSAPFNSVVTGTFLTNYDLDNQTLTYNVYRSGVATPIWTGSAPSEAWSRPTLSFQDSGLSPGTTYYYYVTASDPDGNTVRSGTASVTTPTNSPGVAAPTDAYGKAVYNTNPSAYWRLADTGTTTAADASNYQVTGRYAGGYTQGVSSPVSGSGGLAVTFNGTNGTIGSNSTFANPTSYSELIWFKTTTTRGGKLIGLGSSRSGNSGSYDRQIYMTNSGQLVFGAYPGSVVTLTSANAYNDGNWHFVAATQGADGMHLYVDGQLVGSNTTTGAQNFSGYLRVGGDNLNGWPNQPSSNYFAGTLDEAAFYQQTELTTSQVQSIYHASPASTNANPIAVPASSCTQLTCSFDGSASYDPDGTVASYAWNFGDGTTGTGEFPQHTYTAGGTYTVTLTVTDNSGGTGTASGTVTVTAPPHQPPTASFTSSCTGLTCQVDGTGSSDTDGTITGYSWNFGDGSSAVTTATASHTYASSGTYTVTLTVTDNAGATGTATSTVHATVVVASDGFNRTTTNGWGTADTGGAWTVSPASAFATSGGNGTITLGAPGASATASLNAVSATNTIQTLSVTPTTAATGNGYFLTVRARINGSSMYELKLRFLPGGVVHLVAGKIVAGTETVFQELNVAAVTWSLGSALNLQVGISGNGTTSSLTGTVWAAGTTQPASPQLSVSDSDSTLQGAGAVGLQGYLSGTSTTSPVGLTVDNYSALAD